MKKLFRLMLLLSITALIFSLSAMAADIVSEGECGDNLTWTLDAEGLLTVSGNGKMDTYTFYPEVPYYSNMQDIKTVIIENGVTSIGNWAFATCGSLTEIVISQSVTSIGDYAFSDCSNLTSAIFKGAVPTEFGESVFSNVADDFKIFYYNGNSGWNDFNSDYPIVQIDENTSSVPSVIASGTCGDNITWTLFSDGLLELSGSGDMWNYTDDDETPSPFIDHRETIKTINISEGITSIGDTAFVDCDNLMTVAFPASLASIGSRSFQKCDSLTAIALNNGLTHLKDHAFEFCKTLSTVTLPDTLVFIGEKAFAECEELTAIALPASLTEIGANPFCLCPSLETITVASDNQNFAAVNNILYSKDLTTLYVDPSVLREKTQIYTVPASVERIAARAYSNCTSLVSVTFPDSLKEIGDRAFQNCENLETIVFPDGLETIVEWAFEYCSSLTSFTLPEGLKTIGNRAFQCCANLTDITLPAALTEIGDNVFDECPQLVSAIFEGNVPSNWHDDVFGTSNVNSEFVIYYYDGFTNWTTPTWTAPDGTVYHTVKLSEGELPEGTTSYSVSLSAPSNVTVGNTFTVTVITNKAFAAAELTLTYDETAWTYVGVEPKLTGNATVKNGTITLVDFGSTKTGYVLTFTAAKTGTTDMTLASAKFSTAKDAASSDLTDATITNGTVSVTVSNPTLNVTLGEYLSGAATVVSGSDYTFNLIGDTEYYNYTMHAAMGGENVGYVENSDGSYTISDVTADLVISAVRTAKTYSIKLIDTSGVELSASGTASYGTPVSLDIPQENYYTVSVQSVTYDSNGATVPYNYENERFTIEGSYVTGDITVTIGKTLILNASYKEYLTLDGSKLWLIINNTEKATDKTYTYNGNAMLWSDKYNGYCTLVVSESNPEIRAEDFDLINGTTTNVDYGMDVNKSGKVDANDAQLAYNMYRPMYSGISSDITVEKYLRADVNGDKTVNTMDAAAIVNYILNIN